MRDSLIGLLIFFLALPSLVGQTESVVVRKIDIVGAKKTRPLVIYNELDFVVGDTLMLSTLDRRLLGNQQRLLSTGLFVKANFNIKEWDTEAGEANIEITLAENLHIYPSLIFEFADRDFNLWWKEFGLSLSRVNYGLRLDHLSLTGHKDRLKVQAHTGYTDKLELEYDYPYIGKNWGLGAKAFYAANKEIGYITLDNQTQFRKTDDERVLLKRLRLGISATKRSNAFVTQRVDLEYHDNRVDDIVARELNPNYFLDGRSRLRFFYLSYNWQYDKRVYPIYPLGGHKFAVNAKKEGLGVFGQFNNLSLALSGEKHWHILGDLYGGALLKAKTNLIRSQLAFANNTALGWDEDKIKGYELYVMDGTDFAFLKTNLKYRLANHDMDLHKYMPIKALKVLPIQVWVRLSLDGAWVHEPTYISTNDLNNKLVVGGGPAIDILLYNTMSIQVEYNFNQRGESGLFFQFSFNF